MVVGLLLVQNELLHLSITGPDNWSQTHHTKVKWNKNILLTESGRRLQLMDLQTLFWAQQWWKSHEFATSPANWSQTHTTQRQNGTSLHFLCLLIVDFRLELTLCNRSWWMKPKHTTQMQDGTEILPSAYLEHVGLFMTPKLHLSWIQLLKYWYSLFFRLAILLILFSSSKAIK